MAGYKYGGTNFDIPAVPKPTQRRAFDPEACGSMRGYKQHLRFHETACRPCKDACAENMVERRRIANERGDHSAFKPAKCGTVAGNAQHRNMGVPMCEPCRQANVDYCKARRAKLKKTVTR